MTSVLVTGSEGGIGSAVVEELGRRGNVVTPYDPWAEDRKWDIADLNLEDFDAVVVCHGINEPRVAWPNDAVMDANYNTVIELARAWRSKRTWAEEHSYHSFVAVTSNSAVIPRSKSTDYCVSKAAVDMALRVMQRDHGERGFYFYSFAAGHVDTPMFKSMSDSLGADVMNAGYRRSPLKRLITSEELARTIGFIVGDPQSARWLSGNTLRFDGGEH